jgi:hypothetical protein
MIAKESEAREMSTRVKVRIVRRIYDELWNERRLEVAGRSARPTAAESRAQEDAAIDAEDFLTQAEEANALDPVG